MKQKNKILRFMTQELEKTYGWGNTERVLELAQGSYEKLCRENASDPKAVKAHTEKMIYPTIALYRAMLELGLPNALQFLDQAHSRRVEPSARSIRNLLKLPGLYKKLPAMYKWMTVHNFGVDAGFHADFLDSGPNRCQFNMTKCVYCDTCRKYGCPELIPCFCHTDDVTTGNMHEKILWNRTRTMGEGGDCCDFDVIVLQEGEDPGDYRKK